jgi:hypothetical protein
VVVAAITDDAGRSFSSWNTLTEAADLDGDGMQFGLGEGNGGDNTTTVTIDSTADITLTALVFPDEAGLSFTSGPTEAPATNGFTISGTLTGTGTLTAYAVGVAPADGAPSCTQIKAGQNDAGTSADLSANEVWTTGVGDSFTMTRSGAWPRYDVHVCGSNGTNDTAVTSLTAQDRSPDSGQGITALTSLVATSPWNIKAVTGCDTTLNSNVLTGCASGENDWVLPGETLDMPGAPFTDVTDIVVESTTDTTITLEAAATASSSTLNITVNEADVISPAVASGDVIEADSQNSATDTITIEADGDVTCAAPCSSTGDFWSFDYNIQDISDTSAGDFDAGLPTWSNGDATLYVGGSRPVIVSQFEIAPTVTVGTPIALDIGTSYSEGMVCTDADGQDVTYSVRETLPTGMSLSSAGVLSGTPSGAEDEAGTDYTFDCRDSGHLYATPAVVAIHVVTSWTRSSNVGDSLSTMISDIETEAPWLVDNVQVTVSTRCDATVAADVILSQTPAAGEVANAYPGFTAVISSGSAPCALRYIR